MHNTCNITWYFENLMAGKCAMEANKRKKVNDKYSIDQNRKEN